MQSSDLVHEVYLRLVNARELDWQHRAHFFAVGHADAPHPTRPGRRKAQVNAAASAAVGSHQDARYRANPARELVALDDALEALAEVDPRKSRIVELRFFGGLSVKETAEVLKVSSDTVMRDWKMARAWLLTELSTRP